MKASPTHADHAMRNDRFATARFATALATTAGVLFITLALSGVAGAVEVAPRISDREIVERLTRLEEGQRTMREEIGQRFSTMQENIDQRFLGVDQRLGSMEEKFEQRFASMEKRMDAQWTLTLILIAAIFGLVGFVVWDRKTAFRPLEENLDKHSARAAEVERDLEIDSPHEPYAKARIVPSSKAKMGEKAEFTRSK